ncbi:MAG: PHP domain-containing protein [Balneolaceae bacterium]
MGKADLHTHTTASDGTLSPGELVALANKKGLKILSITDHDTVKGYLEAKEIAAASGIELISGVEITAIWNQKEVHILAYGFDEHNPDFIQMLRKQKKARLRRMKSIVEKLRKQGLDIDMDEVRAESGPGNVGRPHAASVLIRKGYVASVAEAFIRYLSTEKLTGIQTDYVSIEDVVKLTRQAGGVLSLAHPGPLYSRQEIDELLSSGLDGLECIHPSHNFNVQRTYTKMAQARHLLVTGGSDFHGSRKSDYDPYFGIVTVGEQFVASIKRMAARRKND